MKPFSDHNLYHLLLVPLLLGLTQALTSHPDLSALQALKASVKPGSIPSWSCLASWDFSASDPCASPRRTHFTCGVTCSQDSSRVTHITLDSAGYSGPLTPLLSQLSQLITLDLSENSFYGAIPSSIASLLNLKTLVLHSNSFSGSLPHSLTRLNSLQSLDLSRNSLTGSLPKSMNSLSSLRRLDLSYNQLTGSIPELPRNLIELALKANALSGLLMRHSFAESTLLEVMEIAENSFAGTLGAWFFLLPSVQQVDLANNSLTRVEVPPPDASSELVALDLGFNRIQGYAPAKFASYPRLTSLSMRYNRLRGAIPSEYGESRTLRRLYLDGNFLTGTPPVGFLQPGSLVFGSLGDNCLRGCPGNAKMCAPSQKPHSVCKQKQAHGRKPRS